MSLLGKLLIVLNLLVAGAFAYFTLENWKVRRDLTRAAVVRSIQLEGLPVEAPATQPADLADGYVPFRRDINKVPYESLPKETIGEAIPKGGDLLGAGGETVTNQTQEVERVQKKVLAAVPAAGGQDPNGRFQWLRAYLLAIARTGFDRDGVNAVFDMRDPGRAAAARRDLPLAARTESQVAALKALNSLTDLGPEPQNIPEAFRATRIQAAREAIKRFALAEVPHGAGTTDQRSQEWTKLQNALLSALQDRAGDAQKQAVVEAAAADKKGFEQIAAVVVEPLADRASVDRAAAALVGYALSKAITKPEEAALSAIGKLIRPPVQGFDLNAEVDAAGTNLLTAQFEEAALPAATKASASADSAGEKARKIAHLLYHIDGWRYADPKSAADRKAWHERVATIVGLPAYVYAAEAQATEYAEAAQRLVAVITEEQSTFEAEYQAQLQRVLFLYGQWLALDSQLKAQQAITAENVRLMNERKTERDNLRQELEQAKENAKQALAKLAQTQQDLFTILRQVRDAQEALLVLEEQLRTLEGEAQRYDDRTAGR